MEKLQIINKAKAFARSELGGDPSGHDWWHVWRVAKLAKRLAAEEQADAFICELTAWLHDVADEKLNDNEETGLQKVELWLKEHGIDIEDQQHILAIIQTMSFKGGGRQPMQTLEGKVVQDADRLDALGAIGIARTFAYSGARGQLIYDPSITVREHLTHAAYRNEKSTAINHFYEKLLKLKVTMNTAYGQQLAEERHRFMLEYLDNFYKEWEEN
ncbi:phosphohydrolase [Pullulanibacillus camelliae]|uniref:Phosphohydrolase n=1 Tax=Pullulanibacillus camelliae TaxID=1707096 RepID=A0A8J2YDG1_9BACL|nr:HD domain-containing protein [Pullulanibacillus camelliae]GGE39829.1 phosphohydrolase [Pullulanibacillus camelliae]